MTDLETAALELALTISGVTPETKLGDFGQMVVDECAATLVDFGHTQRALALRDAADAMDSRAPRCYGYFVRWLRDRADKETE